MPRNKLKTFDELDEDEIRGHAWSSHRETTRQRALAASRRIGKEITGWQNKGEDDFLRKDISHYENFADDAQIILEAAQILNTRSKETPDAP